MEFVRKVTNDIYFKHFLLRYNFQELAQKNNLVCETDLIFVTNYIRGEKIVKISAYHVWQLWGNWNFRCVHMRDVEKSEILHIWHVCDVENVAIYAKFIAIYAVLLLNLLFTLFCRKIFATIYALSRGEKLSPKVHLWRKNDKYQVCCQIWDFIRQLKWVCIWVYNCTKTNHCRKRWAKHPPFSIFGQKCCIFSIFLG